MTIIMSFALTENFLIACIVGIKLALQLGSLLVTNYGFFGTF